MTRFRMPVKRFMTFGPCQETSKTAITSNPESNFNRREKNHSLFHWNTLTYPELHTQIWMLSKSAASMIVGTSMGQEICLILGQVSLGLLFWKKKNLYVVPGEINEKTADIQARSFNARALEENGKKCPAEGEVKVVTWKNQTRWCQKITRNLFHWPWGQGIHRNHQECSQEIGNTSGSCYALQDKQEQSAWDDQW